MATIAWVPLQGPRIVVFPAECDVIEAPPEPALPCKGPIVLGLALLAWAPVALALWFVLSLG